MPKLYHFFEAGSIPDDAFDDSSGERGADATVCFSTTVADAPDIDCILPEMTPEEPQPGKH